MRKHRDQQADGWKDEEMDVSDPRDNPERRMANKTIHTCNNNPNSVARCVACQMDNDVEDKRFNLATMNNAPIETGVAGSGPTRTFNSGATRDTNSDKLDYYRFNNALVDKVYAEYMHKHRKQSDGKLRDGDNWQKGWDKQVSAESMMRHVQDIKLHLTGYNGEATENLVDSICATIFNAKAMLLEVLKDQGRTRR